ncbi:hypothetical protein [Afifella marina]|uniref:Uncharacterized protein n=1 Tax=Afifella marina DSM 2698 TaxID=1120955 RepID=A0A1G5PB83_AFIMA|nr:hypothetical protein [Afifella marina]SCZ46837.1 hypothetical protein SAMN03080610_03738 [Afifella marina DSM 2698]
MTSEIEKHADDVANILGHIPKESYENNPAAALEIMSHTIALTRIPLQVDRRKYANEILRNLGANFYYSYNEPFRARISTLIGGFQALPHFNDFGYLKLSNEELVREYILVRRVLYGMSLAGIGSGTAKAKQVVKDAASEAGKPIKEAIRNRRMPDGSDILRGARKGAGALPKSPVRALVWVVGIGAYSDLSDYKIKLSNEIRRRWKNKEIKRELYEKAFGSILYGVEEYMPILPSTEDSDNSVPEQYESPEHYFRDRFYLK